MNRQQELIEKKRDMVCFPFEEQRHCTTYCVCQYISDLIAEIQRLDRHMERLGDDNSIWVSADNHGLNHSDYLQIEINNIQAYARANRYSDDHSS